MKKISGILVLITAVYGCSVGPKPIAYGETSCEFCRMTVVDKQHAAQLVTKKGKVYNFDASECMLNYLNTVENEDVAFLSTNTYHNPEELIDATQASFLISEGIPSPMGAFLTAFDSFEEAEAARKEHQGKIYTWEELREKFKERAALLDP